MFLACSKQVQKDSSLEDEVEEQASPLREDRQTLLLAPRTEMVTAVALRSISKKMKVTAAQRVVMSLRAQQCSPVGDHLDG
eukprot:scaffold6794_cov58-Phaeocystis_antarctica.AAC.4